MSEWIGVRDSLPDIGKRVLVYVCRGDAKIDIDMLDPDYVDTPEPWFTYCKDAITHWMPLPKPPKE